MVIAQAKKDYYAGLFRKWWVSWTTVSRWTKAVGERQGASRLHVLRGPWAGTLKRTHYWNCNGQGCDATILQPWDASSYWSPSQYAPQDPEDHGGPSEYGEKMWFTGAASDALADLLGDDDGCCGSDTDSTGCGKCMLLRNPGAVQADWRAIAMKKNRCPPWSSGCDRVHFDLAVPGFDHYAYSTANVCGPHDWRLGRAAAGSRRVPCLVHPRRLVRAPREHCAGGGGV